ncbi:MAG: TDT family transporter [Halothiobacillus sp.]
MKNRIRLFTRATPTPMAGLALGLASLGWCWEFFLPLHGAAQVSAAVIAGVLLLMVATKFLHHPDLLREELAHPVVGSVVPTFTMAMMVVSKAVGLALPTLAIALWLLAVALHVVFLFTFAWHRLQDFRLAHMVPAWFVPPVGLIVADVTFPEVSWLMPLAHGLLYFGLVMYAVMLPMMIHRLIFAEHVPDAAKPTIAIMAAPASLSLAGYLTVMVHPDPLIVALLGGIAVLMTLVIYLAFFSLLRLPFSPGYAAFTFPMAIGVTALVKLAAWMGTVGMPEENIALIHQLSDIELIVATVMVIYVAVRYVLYFLPRLLNPAHVQPGRG